METDSRDYGMVEISREEMGRAKRAHSRSSATRFLASQRAYAVSPTGRPEKETVSCQQP